LNADELLKKHQILLAEHKALLEENEILKARLRIIDPPRPATSEELEEHLLLDFAAPVIGEFGLYCREKLRITTSCIY
jgi:hypothetical protein